MKFYQLGLICILAGCATSLNRNVAQDVNTKYYYGEVSLSSADGKIPYGKSVSLIKRTVDPAKEVITEVVLQPPRNTQQKPKDINTTLTRIGSSNVFSATDDEHTFDGKLTFAGTDWNWENWTYDIKLLDGSKLNGSGLMDSIGIKTQKTFYKPDGTASVLLKEDLKSINSDEYELRHKQIMGNP